MEERKIISTQEKKRKRKKMAKINNITTMVLNLVLMLSFLLIISVAEGRYFPGKQWIA